jgi:hypothetical protein
MELRHYFLKKEESARGKYSQSKPNASQLESNKLRGKFIYKVVK